MTTSTKMEAKAFLRNVPMSQFKVRRVLDQIRGRSYEEAILILEFMPYRACKPIYKALVSAAANAKHNLGMKKSTLFISEARADQGPVMKRFRPRAQGRGFPIKKPTCHIIIGVQQNI